LKKYGMISFWANILAIAGIIIDSYYINGNIYPNVSLSLLILLSVCLVTQSIISALRIAEVYKDLAVSASRMEQARKQITIQKEYYDALSAQMMEIRGIKHDLRHFIGVIMRLSEEGKHEELKRFLGEYSKETETDPLPFFCENVAVNSILGYYSLKAKKGGIPFTCTCRIPKQISVSEIDLCIVLGNALENAVEACSRLENPKTGFVSVEVGIVNRRLLIKIENAYNGHIKLSDGKYLSVKKGKTGGIGIQNIRKVVEAYEGYHKIKHNGKVFTLMAAFSLSAETENDANSDRLAST
jgi:sensor histidine kinase regulating citrate/malate metabolism